jgi:rhodanese-related sulfurtransferase
VAAALREAGFPDAFGILGGLEGCAAAGLPVVPKTP